VPSIYRDSRDVIAVWLHKQAESLNETTANAPVGNDMLFAQLSEEISALVCAALSHSGKQLRDRKPLLFQCGMPYFQLFRVMTITKLTLFICISLERSSNSL
jgi:hypothetical protein